MSASIDCVRLEAAYRSAARTAYGELGPDASGGVLPVTPWDFARTVVVSWSAALEKATNKPGDWIPGWFSGFDTSGGERDMARLVHGWNELADPSPARRVAELAADFGGAALELAAPPAGNMTADETARFWLLADKAAISTGVFAVWHPEIASELPHYLAESAVDAPALFGRLLAGLGAALLGGLLPVALLGGAAYLLWKGANK